VQDIEQSAGGIVDMGFRWG